MLTVKLSYNHLEITELFTDNIPHKEEWTGVMYRPQSWSSSIFLLVYQTGL